MNIGVNQPLHQLYVEPFSDMEVESQEVKIAFETKYKKIESISYK